MNDMGKRIYKDYEYKKGIVALVPAREGSKRVPGKNGRRLGGEPLFLWSVRTAQEVGIEVWVSSDSEEYLRITGENTAKGLKRPKELAGDEAGDYEVIRHFLDNLEEEPELLVYLRPTTPFRDPKIVREAIQKMKLVKGYDSLRSVELMGESVYKCFERNQDGMLLSILSFQAKLAEGYHWEDLSDCPNQKCPLTYRGNGYVDIMRPGLVKDGSLWGSAKYGFLTPLSIEIDTEEDWKEAENYFRLIEDYRLSIKTVLERG